jgi:hypothetical protein
MRVGNADADTFFIGPEFPGVKSTGDPPVGTKVPDFKVGDLLKPQAARFRIWEYVQKGGKLEPSREITLDTPGCLQIVWRVHLANRKASFFKFQYLQGEASGPSLPRRNDRVTHRRKLDIDPLARQIGGRNRKGERYEFRKGKSRNPSSELWPTPAPSPPIEYLGELRTDPLGRLIVIGGKGQSSGLPGAVLGSDLFNNDGWFDDVSDGTVTAELTMKVGGKTKVYSPNEVEGAWVICGPPDFAPSLENQVTLYDVLYDVAARQMTLPTKEALFDTVLKPLAELNAELLTGTTLSRYVPSFDDDIYPIISRGYDAIFTFEALRMSHGSVKNYAVLGGPKDASGNKARQDLFDRLHVPGVPGNPVGVGGKPNPNMPLMHGDAYGDAGHSRFMLTLTDTQYAMMKRWADGHFKPTAGTFPPVRPSWMTSISPHGLDRAALENCVGGAFAVGIEVSWQIRNKKLYSAPFRINHRALTQFWGESGRIRPGHFTRQMALPWQTDFLGCTLTDGLGWWPAQRPDIVYATKPDFDDRNSPPAPGRPAVPKYKYWTRASSSWPVGGASPSKEEFVEHYYKLGVVREGPAGYHLEDERKQPTLP